MRANPNYPPNVPYIEPHGSNHDRYVIQRNTGVSNTIQLFDPESGTWTWFQGDGMTIFEAQYKLWDLVAAMAAPTPDCTPSCGYIGAECDYPSCKFPGVKPEVLAIDDAISSLLWCERRLKHSYGDLAHIQRAIAGLEAMKATKQEVAMRARAAKACHDMFCEAAKLPETEGEANATRLGAMWAAARCESAIRSLHIAEQAAPAKQEAA